MKGRLSRSNVKRTEYHKNEKPLKIEKKKIISRKTGNKFIFSILKFYVFFK